MVVRLVEVITLLSPASLYVTTAGDGRLVIAEPSPCRVVPWTRPKEPVEVNDADIWAPADPVKCPFKFISSLSAFPRVTSPVTPILPFMVNPANVGVSVVCNPKSTAEAATPFVVSATSPCAELAIDEPLTVPTGKSVFTCAELLTTLVPFNIVAEVIVPPNEVSTPAIVIPSFESAVFGMFVNVLASPLIDLFSKVSVEDIVTNLTSLSFNPAFQ